MFDTLLKSTWTVYLVICHFERWFFNLISYFLLQHLLDILLTMSASNIAFYYCVLIYIFFHRNQDISDQCFAECRLDYLSCRAECQSSLCDSQCLEDFQNCESTCPCSVYCPSGCKDCPDHPLCNPQSSTEATTTELVPIEPARKAFK